MPITGGFRYFRLETKSPQSLHEAYGVPYDNYRVRHPSYGGQTEFLTQMEQIYSINCREKSQLRLI